MKYLLILLTPLVVFAKVHYAKVEPYETSTLKSAVSGQVIISKLPLEGTTVTERTIIQIDDALDKVDLDSSQKSLSLINNMISTNQAILSSLKETLNRQEQYYNRIKDLGSASQTQKDNAFYAYANAKTQYHSTREKLDSLKKQKLDMEYKIALLKDQISKKSIKLTNQFLYKLMVNQGDFVAPGTPLAQINDLSRAKLVLFLEEDELQNIDQKTIYINDQATQYKVSKIWSVADEKFISSYRTEILIDNPKETFSTLLKVEFK